MLFTSSATPNYTMKDTPALSHMTKPSITLSFRRSGYQESEFDDLSSSLADLADVRLDPQSMPAAGASFDLDVVVEFVGPAIGGGVLWDALKALGAALGRLWTSKQSQRGLAPDIGTITLRLSDLEITLDRRLSGGTPDTVFLSKGVVERAHEIAAAVFHTASFPPLSEFPFERITVLCRNTDESASTPLYDPKLRVWLTGDDRASIYEPATGKLYASGIANEGA
jgi:hypothetical protein